MSRIYFHTPQDKAAVRGSERAYFGRLCSDLFNAIFEVPGVYSTDRNRLACFYAMFGEHHYIQNYIHKTVDDISVHHADWLEFKCAVETFFKTSDYRLFGRIPLFGLILNTAYVVGGDSIKLAARIHGQCEVHGWVDGPNRNWLAGIIESAVMHGVYRQEQGWDSVINLLKSRSDAPVVMSYSVCDSFPNCGAAGIDYEQWDLMSEQEQWDAAIQGLRDEGRGLELKPDNWNDFHFDQGWDASKLNQLLDWGASVREGGVCHLGHDPLDVMQEIITHYNNSRLSSAKACWADTAAFVAKLKGGSTPIE